MRDGSVKVPIGMPDDDGSPCDHAMLLPCRVGHSHGLPRKIRTAQGSEPPDDMLHRGA